MHHLHTEVLAELAPAKDVHGVGHFDGAGPPIDPMKSLLLVVVWVEELFHWDGV